MGPVIRDWLLITGRQKGQWRIQWEAKGSVADPKGGKRVNGGSKGFAWGQELLPSGEIGANMSLHGSILIRHLEGIIMLW